MRKPGPTRDIPPPLELQCLRALWSLGEGNVKDVRSVLTANRNLAYTTVMTILDRLVKKNGVARRKVGRSFVYTPMLSREALRRLAVKELVDSFFDGNMDALAEWLRSEDAAAPSPLEQPVESEPAGEPEDRLDTALL